MFIAAWNVDDDDARLRLLRDVCAEDAIFVNPGGGVTEGYETLSASIGEFRRMFPAARVGY